MLVPLRLSLRHTQQAQINAHENIQETNCALCFGLYH